MDSRKCRSRIRDCGAHNALLRQKLIDRLELEAEDALCGVARCSGIVSFGKDTKGKQRLIIKDADGNEHEELIPKWRQVIVFEGEHVEKGETVVDGEPWVVPLLYARDGDRIILHGSTGAGALRHVAAGAPAALSVVHLDAVVVAHNTFDTSMNYRSAVVYGTLRPITDAAAKRAALTLVSEAVLPGREAEVEPMTSKQLAATGVTEMAIREGEWVVKARTGGPGEPDVPTDAWTGVVPLRTVADEPVAEARSAGQDVPASVRERVRRGTAAV